MWQIWTISGRAPRLQREELHQRLEQRPPPERPPQLLQARTGSELEVPESKQWVNLGSVTLVGGGGGSGCGQLGSFVVYTLNLVFGHFFNRLKIINPGTMVSLWMIYTKV